MRDGVNENAEESLKRALAEFAAATGGGVATARAKWILQDEVRARANRRRMLRWMAAAAALTAVLFGITLKLHRQPVPAGQLIAGRTGSGASALTGAGTGRGAPSASGLPTTRVETALRPRPTRIKGSATKGQRGVGQWRAGEMALTPWYYNTAVAPAARGVLVHSEVDAATARRFGVVAAGETTPVEILFGEDGLPRALRFVQRVRIQRN